MSRVIEREKVSPSPVVRKASADEIRRQPEYQFITRGTPVPDGILLQTSRTLDQNSYDKLDRSSGFVHVRMTRSASSSSSRHNWASDLSLSGSRFGRGILDLQKRTHSLRLNQTGQRQFQTANTPVETKKEVEEETLTDNSQITLINSDCPQAGKALKKEIRFSENSHQLHLSDSDGECGQAAIDKAVQSLASNLETISLGPQPPSRDAGKADGVGDDQHQYSSGFDSLYDPTDVEHQQQGGYETRDRKPKSSLLKTILQDSSSENYSNTHFSVKNKSSSHKRQKKPRHKQQVSPKTGVNGILINHSSSTDDCDHRMSNSNSTKQQKNSNPNLERGQSQYDAKLEKSSTYLHAQSRTFTRASQYMTNNKRGLTMLNVHYSQTNTAHNDRIIFTHLLKTAHVRNALTGENVYNLERRLYTKRHDPARATTFYDRFEHRPVKHGRSKPSSAPPRTMAAKKQARKKRISRRNEELELGYTPRAWSLTPVGHEEIEHMLDNCRYLRVDVRKQPRLYGSSETDDTLHP